MLSFRCRHCSISSSFQPIFSSLTKDQTGLLPNSEKTCTQNLPSHPTAPSSCWLSKARDSWQGQLPPLQASGGFWTVLITNSTRQFPASDGQRTSHKAGSSAESDSPSIDSCGKMTEAQVISSWHSFWLSYLSCLPVSVRAPASVQIRDEPNQDPQMAVNHPHWNHLKRKPTQVQIHYSGLKR